ncbi:hypothetical protein BH10BDE1_BH10BDE1_03650 [soil metagenome]
MKYQSMILSALAIATSLTMAACASKAPEGDIASTANPQDEIARLDTDIKNSQMNDVDVLDFKNYDKAVKNLEEAKSDFAKKEKQEEILNDLRTGRQALVAAKGTSEYRRTKAPAIFVARQAALKVGAGKQPELQSDWTKIDREVIADAEDLSKLKAERLVGIQNSYVELERKAVVVAELGSAKAQIAGAENDGAKKRASQTFKTAQLDYAQAESVVSTNVRNEAGYTASVQKANASARMLSDVMTTIKANGNKLPENTAIKMVMQDRKIKGLSTDLSMQKSETASAESDARSQQMAMNERLAGKDQALANKDQALANKDQALRNARHTIGVQAALEKARQEFSATDAEAYQQGKNLVIRLKTMSFASGRSDLPESALPILAKVSDVAKELGASKIVVEGHTDSLGGKAKNQTLSEKRADAVATYFKSNGLANADVSAEGFGLSKPLASNKSASGRAQNRRVDIVITPEAESSAPARSTQSTDSEPSAQE